MIEWMRREGMRSRALLGVLGVLLVVAGLAALGLPGRSLGDFRQDLPVRGSVAPSPPGAAERGRTGGATAVEPASPSAYLQALPQVGELQGQEEGELERAIRYSRTKLALALLASAWSGIALAAILFTGLSARMRDLASRILPGRWRGLAFYVVLLGLLLWLLAMPLDYYSGFVVEHQFGLSTERAGGWLLDQVKGVALSLLLAVPVAAALYWIIGRSPRRWWLGVAGLFILLSVVLATLAPVLISPLFNSYRPVEDRALVDRIEAMAGAVGVRVSEVLEEDTSQRTVKVNAYFTGLGPTKRIVLTDNLLRHFTPDEVVVVIAHELGHQVHDDIWRAIAVGSGFYLAGAYLLFRLLGPIVSRFGGRLGFTGVEDVASLPLLLLLFGILSFAAMPALNSYSRAIEHQADVFALELTRDPRSFVSSMEKLGRLNLSDPDPPRLLEVLFYTHPSIKERVEYARSFERHGDAGTRGHGEEEHESILSILVSSPRRGDAATRRRVPRPARGRPAPRSP